MFKQMQYFISVVETGSFTKAAEECYISQSAISQQIKSLEETLGVKLLRRNKKSFTLTAAGDYFYKKTKSILDEVEELCKKTQEIEEDENVLKIGYLRGFHTEELREAMISFSKMYPNVIIDLKIGNHEELYNYLVNHEVSLVISDQRRAFHDDYVNYHLLHMDCYIEVSPESQWNQKKSIDVEELKEETCILVASKKQQEIEQEFYENIIGLKSHYLFVESIEEARMLVSINRGFMPIEYASRPQHAHVIPLYRHNKPIQRNYCAFWKQSETNYYIEEFADFLRKTLRQHHDE